VKRETLTISNSLIRMLNVGHHEGLKQLVSVNCPRRTQRWPRMEADHLKTGKISPEKDDRVTQNSTEYLSS
jgi:hypothetical protein